MIALGIVLLAIAYYWLVRELVGYSWAIPHPAGLIRMFPTRTLGFMVWSECLNTLAMAVAALPVALTARHLFGRHAVPVSAAFAILATAFAIYPTFGPTIGPLLHGRVVASLFVDCAKMMLLPPLFAWAIARFSSRPALNRS